LNSLFATNNRHSENTLGLQTSDHLLVMALTASGGQSFSLSAAQRNERNILVKLQRSHATKQLYHDLWLEKKAIEAVVAHHLGRINRSTCTVQNMST
jgi:hypothetical protein